jgi:hypothetical protein
MKTAVTWLTSWRALIATFAICCVAPPARADLSLNFTVGGQSQTVSNLSSGTPGTLSYFTGTTLDYTVAYTVTAVYNPATLTQSLNLAATITAAAGRVFTLPTTFSYSAINSGPGLPGTGLTLPGGPGTTVFVGGALSATSLSGLAAFVTNDVEVRDNATNTAAISTSPIFVFGTGTAPPSQSAGIRPAAYNLQVNGAGTIQNGTGFSTSFSSTGTVTALPEPSVVMAALAGLPCMGLLLRLARRGRGSVDGSAAAA